MNQTNFVTRGIKSRSQARDGWLTNVQGPYVRQNPLSGQIMHKLLNDLFIKIDRVYKRYTSSPVFIKTNNSETWECL